MYKGKFASLVVILSTHGERTWVALVNIIRHVNNAGIHHGDLRPSNVCVDPDGRVRAIDWHTVDLCDCGEKYCHRGFQFGSVMRCLL
jgi:RIO-like serine/threonine protein kinase